MFCDAYNKSLTDAAASAEVLSPALQQHLAYCESCRAAFAEEQSLFAVIDSTLHATANSEVPATLIPRVHVALNNEPSPHANPQKWLFASATLACALVFAVIFKPWHRDTPELIQTATRQQPPITVPARKESPLPAPSVTRPAPPHLNKEQEIQPAIADSDIPFAAKILVPEEEREAFAQYMANTSPSPANISAKAVLAPKAPQESVQILPVQIASLDLKPLDQKERRQGQF